MIKRITNILISVFLLLLSLEPVFAESQDIPSFLENLEGEKGTVSLSLQDCIFFALKNNLDIVATRLVPQIKETEIIEAKSDFDPTATLDISADRSETHTTSSATTGTFGSVQKNYDFDAGLQQKFLTGGDYDLSFKNNRLETNRLPASQSPNPAYTSSLTYTLTQPLLRDFGIGVNRADILIAKNNKDISLEELREGVANTMTETEKAYWELVFALENLKVKELSLKRAEDLLETNETRMKAGSASQIEVLAAEAEVASRKQEVIIAQKMLSDVQDNLKVVTNLIQDPKLWNFDIIPLDKPPLEAKEINLVESVRIAFQKRPDYQMEKIDLKNKDIKIKVAKNEVLPTLDLKGSFGLNGLDRHYNDAFDEMSKGDYESWSAGLSFEYPLGNRGARSKYKKRLLEKEKALIDFKNLEQRIMLEIREAVRGTNTDYKRVAAAETVRRLRERKLEAEEERFKEGLTTTHDILEYQEDLAEAQSGYLRSVIDYNKSLIDLERAKGTVLERENIYLEE